VSFNHDFRDSIEQLLHPFTRAFHNQEIHHHHLDPSCQKIFVLGACHQQHGG
jgi:hypothetical protein